MTELAPEAIETGAKRIVAQLQKAGHTALWAGGCVRDMLMQRTPKDFDIATSALPDQVLDIFPRSLAVGKAFGVIRTPWHGHYYEVATFRKDSAYQDGRRPDYVVFADAETDAQRRDFTVNAMFFDPTNNKLHDYVNGQADLKARLIRAVGDAHSRFAEDHLRLLRAVRFAGTLDFEVHPATIRAIRANAASISRISAERIQQEISRILLEAHQPGNTIRMLADLDLLQPVLPEVAAMQGQAQPPEFHPEGDVFTHTVLMLNAMRNPAPALAWAVLLHDIGKPPTCRVTPERLRFDGHASTGAEMAETLMKRLRMSNEMIKTVTFSIANHMRFMEVQRMKRSTLLRLISAPSFPMELELHRLDCLASHGDMSNHEFLTEFIRQRAKEPVLPDPLLTGRDIMAEGIKHGPAIGRWKKAAYEAQLNNTFKTHAAATAWLRKQISNRI